MEPMQAEMQPMRSVASTPEEKLQRRRARRWKRRARIAGPFLGIMILLTALSLSVDLIEYQPREDAHRLSDRPIRLSPRPTRERTVRTPSFAADSIASKTSNRDPAIGSDIRTLDLSLPSTRVARAPTAPEATR